MITKDSRECTEGSIFFCFVGENFDGHDMIGDAIKNGAIKVYGTKDIKDIDIYEKVEDIELIFAEESAKYYSYEDVNMKFCGVTGTDGKTSTAILIDKILNKLSSSSYLGTSGFFVNGELKNYSGMTSLFPNEMYKNIHEANYESEHFIMEVSSHALKQKRVYGLSYDLAIFTNFTRDHLDFHKTIDDYFASKLKIINYLKESAPLFVNDEIERLEEIKQKYDNVVTFGENGDAKILDVNLSLKGLSFNLEYQNKKYHVKSNLIGRFNVYNLASAILAANYLGFAMKDILKIVENIEIDGRMQYIENQNSADLILDFAHTPDAISKVMNFINEFSNNKIYVVTGSAGGRDMEKRPEMGYYASQFTDELILTMDDPRFEKVSDINKQIASGVENENCIVTFIEDRREALQYVIKKAEINDIIVCLGKTGQHYMYIEDRKVNYSEYDTVNDIIRSLNV